MKEPVLFAAAGAVLGVCFLVPGSIACAGLAWVSAGLLCWRLGLGGGTLWEFFAFGLGVQATVYYWLPPIISHYGKYPAGVAWILCLFFLVFSTMQLLFAGLLYRGLVQTRLGGSGLALPCAWLAAEVLFPGFIPWMLGHTQIEIGPLAGVAEIFGVPLISFLMLWWCELLRRIIAPLAKDACRLRRIFPAAVLNALILGVYGFSCYREGAIEADLGQAPQLNIGVVQPNFDALKDFSPENQEQNINKLRNLSFGLVTGSVPLDLLIWPESSVWNDLPLAKTGIVHGSPEDPFPGLGVPLMFGGQARLPGTIGEATPRMHNSIYLLGADGKFQGKYHKQRLFPFSELVPLGSWFPSVEGFVKRSYRVVPGESGPQALALAARAVPNARLAVAICYEDMWSDVLQQQIRDGGPSALIALSNDAWFLGSPAASQHHLLARWRAVELRRYLVRATVDGISGVFDPWGQPDVQVTPLTEQAFSSHVKLLQAQTLFSRMGRLPLHIFSIGICLVAMLGNASEKFRRAP